MCVSTIVATHAYNSQNLSINRPHSTVASTVHLRASFSYRVALQLSNYPNRQGQLLLSVKVYKHHFPPYLHSTPTRSSAGHLLHRTASPTLHALRGGTSLQADHKPERETHQYVPVSTTSRPHVPVLCSIGVGCGGDLYVQRAC